MKKIRNIRQLQDEKRNLKLQGAELELTIRSNWNDLKNNLRPVNIARDTISSVFKKGAAEVLDNDSPLKRSFTYGISLLTKKLVDKAGEKLVKKFRK